MNRIAEQTNRPTVASLFTQFVCPALRLFPREPRKKKLISFILTTANCLFHAIISSLLSESEDSLIITVYNFPFLSSVILSLPCVEVFISQLIQYARVYSSHGCLYLGSRDFAFNFSQNDTCTTLQAWDGNLGRVHVLTRVATLAVDRKSARIISLKRDSTYSGRFKKMKLYYFSLTGLRKRRLIPLKFRIRRFWVWSLVRINIVNHSEVD